MNNFRLHSQFLEAHFGPVRLKVMQQGGGYRMVHLLDGSGVSKTLGVVRFYGALPEHLEEIHQRILAGSPLGFTLMDAGIAFEKRILGRFNLEAPDWLRKAFSSAGQVATGMLSEVYISALTEVSPGGMQRYCS